jgi:hypothetical protein
MPKWWARGSSARPQPGPRSSSRAVQIWTWTVPGTIGGSCGEAVMNGNAASVAYLILAVFLGGVAVGVVAMVAVAIRKEDRQFSLSGAAPGAAARGARRLTRFGGSGTHFQPRGRA